MNNYCVFLFFTAEYYPFTACMFSFSERGALRPVAKVHGKPTSELHGKVLYLHAKEPGIRIDPAKGQFDRIDLPDGARFEWLPSLDDHQTDAVCIVGVRGSGKSTKCAEMAQTVVDCFQLEPDDITLVKKEETADPAFKKLDPRILLADSSLAEDPPTLAEMTRGEDPEHPAPSVIILDDLDVCSSARLKKAVTAFQDMLLLEGRKSQIYLFNIVHRLAKNTETRFLLSESNFISWNPNASSSDMRYVCDRYLDISKDLLADLKKLDTRFVIYHQFAPRYILADRNAWIVDPDRDTERLLVDKLARKMTIEDKAKSRVIQRRQAEAAPADEPQVQPVPKPASRQRKKKEEYSSTE